jgi:hypothetical protein
MKKLLILLVICLLPFALQAQRYRDVLFGAVDSVTVTYGQNVDFLGELEHLQMDIFSPHGDTVSKRPAIILVHGGNFTTGDRKEIDINLLCKALARRGYVTASIDYRLGFGVSISPGDSIKRRDSIIQETLRSMQDTRAAVRYMKANAQIYNLDSNKVYVGGTSAGAIAALLTAYLHDGNELNEVVPEGAKLLAAVGGLEGNSGSAVHSSKVAGVINLCGAVGRADWIKAGDPSVISMHGDQDRTIPYKHAEIVISIDFNFALEGSYLIDSVARSKEIHSVLYTWKNAGHVPFATSRQDMAEVISFVTCNMYKLVNPSGDTTDCNAAQYDTVFTALPLFALGNVKDMELYPNPSTGYVNVTINGHTGWLGNIVEVRNMTGNTVKIFHQINQSERYYVGDLPKGIYTVSIPAHAITKRLLIM